MTRTTLRFTKLAKSSGTSVQSIMREAIAQKADELELTAAFHTEADARLNELLTSGVGVDWDDMRIYLTVRATATKPRAKKPHRA